MNRHQDKVEKIFEIYYNTLDVIREDMLSQEYEMRKMIDDFE